MSEQFDTKLSQNETEKKEANKHESKDFFFSEKLGIYVGTRPLKVDNRVVKAASECGVDLGWDEEGRIVNISYFEARKLADQLGATLLTPAEHWAVYNEALEKGEKEILEQLQSSECTEWLDVVFEKDGEGNVFMIEHPEIIEREGRLDADGLKKKIDAPIGRPGWFNPKGNINEETGMPINVDTERVKGTPAWSEATWKYWSVFKINELVAGIRGYVTSSGTPSLDLDIPVGSKQPVLMLRECRKNLLEPTIDPELMKKAEEFVGKYVATTVDQPAGRNPLEHEIFYNNKEELFKFIIESGKNFVETKERDAQKVKEKLIDMLGIIKIMAKRKGDEKVVQDVNNIAKDLLHAEQKEVNIDAFSAFVAESNEKLKSALESKSNIVFVMGHKNPDTDTAISCLIEAFRNSLIDKNTLYIPVIQGERVPDEIEKLLGAEISHSILLSNNPDYAKALNSGQAKWILVDQNVSEVQKFAISIVDHHILSDKAKKQDIPVTWEMAGSTTALVSQKFSGMGLSFDKELARILYGATLMDTENRSDKKMTYKDDLIMDDLQKTAGIDDDNKFFQELMSSLLNTDDAERLFNRDYKQDWGIFGFAVAKVKGAFNEKGEETKRDLLKRLVNLAEENNKQKNFPLTIIKVVDYLEDNEVVNKERVYLVFNQYVLPEFRRTMFEFIAKIIENEFDGKAKIDQTENSVDFSGVGDQLSRKVTAPFLEPVVEAYNEYFYSPNTGLHVKREFLKADKNVERIAQELGMELNVDREGRINNISYHEAKKLLDGLGMVMMSLAEYWKVLENAEESHDEQMLAHLRSPGFVEFLDTIILDYEYIVDHPKLVDKREGYDYSGDKKKIRMPEGIPGLIHPRDIDPETGFPKAVQNPNQYDNKELWRYWSPDAGICIPTRGHIFLLNQSSFDTKIHPDDALTNLGIRPCCKEVKPPKVNIVKKDGRVEAVISK